jgi:hypothetical protein
MCSATNRYVDAIVTILRPEQPDKYIKQIAHEPLEPPSGSRTVRKRVAPLPKYDVNGCEWLVGATRLLFLRTAREPRGGSNGSCATCLIFQLKLVAIGIQKQGYGMAS